MTNFKGHVIAVTHSRKQAKTRTMTDARKTRSAIPALRSGDAATAIEIASKALEGLENGPPLVKEALEAGIALARAEARGEPPPADTLSFLRFLAAAPVAPEGFRRLRQQFGISQAAIGDLCGVTSQSVGKWESGAVSLPPAAVRALLNLAMKRPDPVPALTGRDIVAIRRALGDSQAAFAKRIGVSVPAVQLWEYRGLRPIPDTATRRVREFTARERIEIPTTTA
jgi:DNA-binding transcriptional regulator YiaG